MPKQRNRVGQKKLRARKKSSQYKTIDRYLNQVYENNKEYIDIHMETYGTKQQRRNIFKNQVKELLNEINPATGKKFSVNQAIDYVQRSEAVRTKGERHFETVLTEIRDSDKEMYKRLRKDLGWKSKIKSENSRYVGFENNRYIYEYRKPNGEKVYLLIEISPQSGTQLDVQVVPEHKFLNKLKMPKALQDAYTNVKNKEQQQVAEAASNAVNEILSKYGGK